MYRVCFISISKGRFESKSLQPIELKCIKMKLIIFDKQYTETDLLTLHD